MTKKQHATHHKKLHAALLLIVADWQACSSPEAYRLPEKRSILSLIEWSARQLEAPDEPSAHIPVSEKLAARRRFQFSFTHPKHLP